MAGIGGGGQGLAQLLPLLLAARSGGGASAPAGTAPGGGSPALNAGAPAAMGASQPSLASLIQNPMGLMLLRSILGASGGQSGRGAPLPTTSPQRPNTAARGATTTRGATPQGAAPSPTGGGGVPPNLAAILSLIAGGAAPTQQPTQNAAAGPYVSNALDPAVSSRLAAILGL